MKLLNTRGRLVNKNVDDRLIKWDEPSASKLQFRVKQFLKSFWRYESVYEEFPVFGTLLRIDFLNITRKIAVEVNGNQHENFSEFFHRSRSAYLQSIKRDYKKSEWLKLNGFTLIEINEKEVDKLSRTFFKEKFDIDIV